eukprot:jgi/Psemu1/305613/fgenesh1_kg.208_\
MELLRYQLFLGAAVAFLSVWVALLEPGSHPLVRYAPVWAIVGLGIYAAGSVVVGTLSFRDTPEAAAEIDRQVLEARAEMTKRGIIAAAQEK